MMRILITPDNGFVQVSGDAPEVGKTYLLEDAINGSLAQSRAWHALLQEYWRSGQHSYNAANFLEFRDIIKRVLGAGCESYVYADKSGIHKVKSLDDVPYHVHPSHIMGRLKSWSKYTKKERANAISNLVAEMHQAGVSSKKFDEILAGLDG